MDKKYELLDVDWITAKMYGRNLKKLDDHLPLSKNGIEKLSQLEEEIDSVMQMIEQKLFSPSKENFWENNLS